MYPLISLIDCIAAAASIKLTSIFFPISSLILANKAELTNWVAYKAVVISKIITGVLCGISSGPLFSDMNPVKACKTGSIAGFALIGPF